MKLKPIIPKTECYKIFQQTNNFNFICVSVCFCLDLWVWYHAWTCLHRMWSRTIPQLGIFPVFPLCEDLQVGDIWLLSMHPLDRRPVELIGGLDMTGIWCDNILQTPEHGTTKPELFHKVSDFYKNRFTFPDSSESFEPAKDFTRQAAEKDNNVLDTEIVPVPTGTLTVDFYDKGTGMITPTTTAEKNADPFELAKQINKYNQTLGQQSFSGGSINIVSVS